MDRTTEKTNLYNLSRSIAKSREEFELWLEMNKVNPIPYYPMLSRIRDIEIDINKAVMEERVYVLI